MVPLKNSRKTNGRKNKWKTVLKRTKEEKKMEGRKKLANQIVMSTFLKINCIKEEEKGYVLSLAPTP